MPEVTAPVFTVAELAAAIVLAQRNLAALEQQEEEREAAEAARARDERRAAARTLVVETLTRHGHVRKQDLVAVVCGRRSVGFELLARMELEGVIMTYRDAGTRHTMCCLSPAFASEHAPAA
ncbi:MAG TPA: hypothetical protein VE987_22265 [Polyangiaceae bacterium]|nr:hypothetical protein [Polyangiaceae bacterium]